MDLLSDRKRDVAATFILALPTLLLLVTAGIGGLSGLGSSVTRTAAQSPTGGSPDIGRLRIPPQPEPKVSTSAEAKTRPAAKQDDRVKGGDEVKNSEPNIKGRLPDSSSAPSPQPATPSLAMIDNSAPNQIEPQPRPVRTLARDEVRRIVQQYQEACRQGAIELLLSFDGVSRQQINAIAGRYYVTSSDNRIRVIVEPGGIGRLDAGGAGNEADSGEPDTAKSPSRLRGPLDRQLWPDEVVAAARRFHGSIRDTMAEVELSDEGTLLVYRTLAASNPKPGKSYRLGLLIEPKTQRPVLRVLGVVNSPTAAAEQPNDSSGQP